MNILVTFVIKVIMATSRKSTINPTELYRLKSLFDGVLKPEPESESESSSDDESEWSEEELEYTPQVSITKATTSKPNYSNNISITYNDFIDKINDDTFIEQYNKALKGLYEYKIGFYREKLKEISKSYNKEKKLYDRLQQAGADRSAISETCPHLHRYVAWTIQLEDLIALIERVNKKITPERTWKNLRSIFYNKCGFRAIIGREDIKTQVTTLLYSFTKSYKVYTHSFSNYIIKGGAGVGKTAIAKVLGYVLCKSGLLVKNYVKICTRADLVSRWVGSTAPLTRASLYDTFEGVLFIDEAYQLYGVGNDTGAECITELVNHVDKHIGMNVIIMAGYEEKMNRLLDSNDGLRRRFPNTMTLVNYTNKELSLILFGFIREKVDEDISKVTNYIYSLITDVSNDAPDAFQHQAGDMLNLGSVIVKMINQSDATKWKGIKYQKQVVRLGLREYLWSKGYKVLNM